jgi:hypothetical protein
MRPFTGQLGNLDTRLIQAPAVTLKTVQQKPFLPPPLPDVNKNGEAIESTDAPPRDPGLVPLDYAGFSTSAFRVSGFGQVPVEKFAEKFCSAIKTIESMVESMPAPKKKRRRRKKWRMKTGRRHPTLRLRRAKKRRRRKEEGARKKGAFRAAP